MVMDFSRKWYFFAAAIKIVEITLLIAAETVLQVKNQERAAMAEPRVTAFSIVTIS